MWSYKIAAKKLAKLSFDTNNAKCAKAINLLDHLVKSLRLPFYLEISTTEFLRDFTTNACLPRIIQNRNISRRIVNLLCLWRNVLCGIPLAGEFYNRLNAFCDYAQSCITETPQIDLESYYELLSEEIMFHPDDIKSRLKYTVNMKVAQLVRLDTADSRSRANKLISKYYGEGVLQKWDYDKESISQIRMHKKAHVRGLYKLLSGKRPEDRFRTDDRLNFFYKIVKVIIVRLELALEKDGLSDDVKMHIENLLVRSRGSVERYRCFINGINYVEPEQKTEAYPLTHQEKLNRHDGEQAARGSLILDESADEISDPYMGPSKIETTPGDMLDALFGGTEVGNERSDGGNFPKMNVSAAGTNGEYDENTNGAMALSIIRIQDYSPF